MHCHTWLGSIQFLHTDKYLKILLHVDNLG